jgi:hypothetical protein
MFVLLESQEILFRLVLGSGRTTGTGCLAGKQTVRYQDV